MVKEPTVPPEGSEKPQPPPNVPSKQGVPPTVRGHALYKDKRTIPFAPPAGPPNEEVRKSGETRDKIPRSPTTGRRLDGLPESAIGVGPDLSDAVSFRGHTSDPTFNPPNRVAGPDDEVVFSEAVACKEHADCMVVESSITSDPGYEPPSRTIDAAPITPTITPQWPEPGWGTAMDEVAGAAGPFWD